MRPAIVPLLLVLAAVPLAAQRGATRSLRLEELAPADSFAFARFAGLDASSAAAEGLGLFQLWKEPQVQRFLAEIVEQYEAMAAGTPDQIVGQWDALERQFGGGLSVVLADVTLLWTDDGPVPMPGVLVGLDVAGRRSEVEQSLAALAENMSFEVSHRSHAGRDVTVLRPQLGPPIAIHYAFVENLLVAGLSQHLVDRCIDNAATDGPSLAGNRALRDARAKADAEPLVELYLDVRELARRVGGLVPLEVREALHTLGLDSIDALYYASAVHDGDSFDTFYVAAPAPRRGLLALGGEGGLDERSLAFVPETAVAVAALDVRVAGAWDALWSAFEGLAPPQVTAQARAQLQGAESELGFGIRDGLLAALGDELVVYAELPRDGVVPNVVMSLALRDGAKVGEILGTVLAASGTDVREVEFGEYALYVVETGAQDVPVKPTFTVMVDRLVVGLTPGALRSALRQLEGGAGPSLVETQGFRDAFRGIDWRGACTLEYVDVPRLVAYGLNAADAMLATADDEELPFDPLLVPGEDIVLRHMNGWAEIGDADEGGLFFRSRSISLATVLALGARFFAEAPGAPPYVLRTAGSGHSIPAPRPAIEVAPVPAQAPAGVVNPLGAGDPREAQIRARIAQLDGALAASPDDGGLHFQRALALGQVRRFEDAIDDYERARELGFRPETTAYNLACSYSLLGKSEKALDWLETALDEGFADRAILDGDSDLDAIRPEPRFEELVERYLGG